MSFPRTEEWPDIGELVIASIGRITNYGVYVALDEYDKEGFLHISEISSSWVKNIRDFVHVGEKTVLKILRVDIERRQIDLSLRRVTRSERRDKILEWKQNKKAEGLMKVISKKLGISLEEIFRVVWIPLENAFGSVYEGLEMVAREGVGVLRNQNLPEELAVAIAEVAKEKIRIRTVKVKGILNISCRKTDGVIKIKNALLKAQRVRTSRANKVRIYVVSPPKYRVEVNARDYKEANSIMKDVCDTAIKEITQFGGQGSFKRG